MQKYLLEIIFLSSGQGNCLPKLFGCETFFVCRELTKKAAPKDLVCKVQDRAQQLP